MLLVRSELPYQRSVKVAMRKPAEKILIVITAFRKSTAAVTHLVMIYNTRKYLVDGTSINTTFGLI